MYYCFQGRSAYNGFINPIHGVPAYPWFSFVAFGKLYALKNHVDVNVEGEHIYATAATNENESGVLLSNFKNEDSEINVELNGLSDNATVKVIRLREGENLVEDFSFTASGSAALKIKLPVWEVAYIKIEA